MRVGCACIDMIALLNSYGLDASSDVLHIAHDFLHSEFVRCLDMSVVSSIPSSN